ncbi:AQP-1 [Fasciola gigantica]|uniref:AQP-1 n=1 Tax=Fasciola gigantica TaxID=46835 RepID=A0A504YPC6_FASGI|nr:AQP-1 [Fasciola gigantica]
MARSRPPQHLQFLCGTIGPVSGPQLTAALSLALLMNEAKSNFVYFILGIAGQFCGALVGIALASQLVPGLSNKKLNLHTPGENVTDGQAFGMECICSFLLIVCCLSTVDEFRNPHWAQGHVTVFSVVVYFLILMLAAILVKVTGCGMNPAASLSAAIFNNNYGKIWIYIVAPVVGSIIAVLFWEMMLSDGASAERIKHWWTDPNFDRTKDYKRMEREANEVYDTEEAMLSISFLVDTKQRKFAMRDVSLGQTHIQPPGRKSVSDGALNIIYHPVSPF